MIAAMMIEVMGATLASHSVETWEWIPGMNGMIKWVGVTSAIHYQGDVGK